MQAYPAYGLRGKASSLYDLGGLIELSSLDPQLAKIRVFAFVCSLQVQRGDISGNNDVQEDLKEHGLDAGKQSNCRLTAFTSEEEAITH